MCIPLVKKRRQMIIRVGGWWSVWGYVDPLPWGESSAPFLLLIRPFFHGHLSSSICQQLLPLARQRGSNHTEVLRVLWTLLYPLLLPDRCECFLHLEHSPSCDLLLWPYSFCSVVCALAAVPSPDWPKSLSPSHAPPCSPNHTTSYIDVLLSISSGTLWVSLSAGTPTWPVRRVYGENVMTPKRFEAKMPFFQREINLKCIGYSSLLDIPVLIPEQGIPFSWYPYRKATIRLSPVSILVCYSSPLAMCWN